MLKTLTRSSVVLAATAAAVAAATAAAAVLPSTASDTARERTAEVTAVTERTAPAKDTVDTARGQQTPRVATEAEGTHGAEVSELATTTELTGAEKGAAIAELASDGRSAARGESADHAAKGEAKAAEASAKGQEKAAANRPAR